MTVTAKVTCTNKVATGEGDSASAVLTFQALYKQGEHQEWAHATPHLHINMTVNGSVRDHFTQGGKYTLTFTPENGG